MNKKRIHVRSLKEVSLEANAAYDKYRKENPDLYPESSRVYFVQGWIETAYNVLYEAINADQP